MHEVNMRKIVFEMEKFWDKIVNSTTLLNEPAPYFFILTTPAL